MANIIKSLFGKKDDAPQPHEPSPQPAQVAEAQVEQVGAEPVHVTDDTFGEVVLDSSLPALVDFWAPWCGPCRMIAPIVEELAETYDGRAVIAKMNTDENDRTAGELGIMGIPTLVLFKNGSEVDRVVGYAPRQLLQEKLDAIVS
jgi:thioredoxin 1